MAKDKDKRSPAEPDLAEVPAADSVESTTAAGLDEAMAAADGDEEMEFDVEDFLRQYRELQESCQAAQAQTAEADAKLLRLQADFDNFRRRQRQESEDLLKQAAAGLVTQLLPVLDNFERALSAMQDSPDKEGVTLISQQLQQVLEQAGLQEIAAAGEQFDPNLHQAVAQLEASAEDKGKVLQVLQRGYTLHGKLLRTAVVQVGM